MNAIVLLMVLGAKKRFSKDEFRTIRREANILFDHLRKENRDIPKA